MANGELTDEGHTVHTVTATDGSFNRRDIGAGGSYSRIFTIAGTVSYFSQQRLVKGGHGGQQN